MKRREYEILTLYVVCSGPQVKCRVVFITYVGRLADFFMLGRVPKVVMDVLRSEEVQFLPPWCQ